jgi:predicted dehydrogenase
MAPSTKVLRVGIIGAGANTRSRHIPGFQAIDGVEVVAVCNRSTESGQRVADQFGIARVTVKAADIIEANDIDAICVGTWPYLHHDLTLATLKAGKHLLTEARMAMNLTEARAMHRAAEASDRVAMIVPSPFYLKYEPTLLALLRDGFFGDLLDIHVRGLGGAYDPAAPLQWRQRRALSGNNIMSMGILNEAIRRYAGHEQSVMAHGKVFTPQRVDPETSTLKAADVPESLGIVCELMSGATAVYHISTVARLGVNGAMEFYGTRGAFKLENGEAFIAGAADRTWQALQVEAGKEGGWRVEQDFIDAIRDGKPVTHTNFTDGVAYMEFTEAVQISLREGRRVQLPLP